MKLTLIYKFSRDPTQTVAVKTRHRDRPLISPSLLTPIGLVQGNDTYAVQGIDLSAVVSRNLRQSLTPVSLGFWVKFGN